MQFYAASSGHLLGYLRTSIPCAHTTWYLGVMLSLVASFAGALGDNLVRLSYVKERERRAVTMRSLYRRPAWLLGFFLSVVVNPLLTVLSLKFAAAAMVLPFGGMHIFWNVLLVGYLLQEKLHIEDICGSLCILTGIIVVISYGPHEAPPVSLSSLSSITLQPTFTFYLLIEAICVVLCLLASTDVSTDPASASSASSSPFSFSASPLSSFSFSSFSSSSSSSSAPAAAIAVHSTHSLSPQEQELGHAEAATPADVDDGRRSRSSSSHSQSSVTSESPCLASSPLSSDIVAKSGTAPSRAVVEAGRLSVLATLQQGAPTWLRRFSLPVLSGIFGGLGNLAAKGLVEIVGAHGLRQSLWSTEFSVCVFATLLFCSLQLLYLNLALFRHEAKHAVPVVNATLIASGSLGGLLLFKEFVNMSSAQVTVFTVGILLVIGGIAILAYAPSGAVAKASQTDLFAESTEEVDGTEEERIALGSFCSHLPPHRRDSAC